MQSLNVSRRSGQRGRDRDNSRERESPDPESGRSDRSSTRACKYCNFRHEKRKEACPSYGKRCRICLRYNHDESVCFSKSSGRKNSRPEVCELDTDDDDYEDLLTLADNNYDDNRLYTLLKIGDEAVPFMLDCGATINLLPEVVVRSMGRLDDVQPTATKLHMFDGSELWTRGLITVIVQHPRTAREYELDFYITTGQNQPLLGCKACYALELLHFVDADNCEASDRAAADEPSCTRQPMDEVMSSPAEVSTLPFGPMVSASKPVDTEDPHCCSPDELQCDPRNLQNDDASPADNNFIERKCAVDFKREAAAEYHQD